MAGRTDVLITADIEFGVTAADDGPERAVAGLSAGLDFIVDTLAASGHSATFFIETGHAVRFGPGPMGGVAQRLHATGHDTELHLHPMWTAVGPPGPDRLAGLPSDRVSGLVKTGLSVFADWGLPPPIAFRAGNLEAFPALYPAIAAAGIRLASNIGLHVFRPREPELHLSGGRHWIAAVMEVPVLSYSVQGSLGKALKTLTITGSSFAETRYLLEQARDAGVGQVVLLTHAHEFVRSGGAAPNQVNRNRFAKLCRYLAENKDSFTTATFRQRAARWAEQGEEAAPSLAVPLRLAVARSVANAVNDLQGAG